MDSDLSAGASDELAQLQWERRQRESGEAATKAQRRAELVMLTAGYAAGRAQDHQYLTPSDAVDWAEAALAEIDGRVK